MAFPGVAAGHGLLQLDQWMFCKTCGKNPANQSNPWAGESSFSQLDEPFKGHTRSANKPGEHMYPYTCL